MNGRKLRLTNFIIDSGIYFCLLSLSLFVIRNIVPFEYIKWLACALYFLYYFIFEYFSGQTIGKMFTNSKVISRLPNKDYYFIRIALRTLIRFIPLDIFSYVFSINGFHDKLSKTLTIKIK
jgi:uncharacterized RDD family membrane protein YckC